MEPGTRGVGELGHSFAALAPVAGPAARGPVQMAGGANRAAMRERDDDESFWDVADEAMSAAGGVGDYLGTGTGGPQGPWGTPVSGGATGTHWMGGDAPVVGGTIGATANLYGAVRTGARLKGNVEALKQNKETLAAMEGAYAGGAAPDMRYLFASVELLRKENRQLKREVYWDNPVGLLSSLNGVANGISTAVSSGGSAAATAVGAVTFAIGGALNALVGTVSAMRDAFNIYKRSVRERRIQTVLQSYLGILAGREAELMDLYTQASAAGGLDVGAAPVRPRVQATVQAIDEATAMLQGLRVAGRKQGAKTKGASLLVNLTSAGGGAALLAATIGGVAAAATPIGWGLAAAAAVAGLTLVIGKAVRKSTIQKNVVRFRAEKQALEADIAAGNLALGAQWNRGVTQAAAASTGIAVPEKSFFAKFGRSGFSKQYPANPIVQNRVDYITRYLAKYDAEEAADNVWAGIKRALAPGAEGDTQVEGPNPPATITLREQIRLMIADFLGKLGSDDWQTDVASFEQSIQADEDSARKLLLQKMKLA